MQVFECNVSINMYDAYVFVNHVLLIYNTRNVQGIKDDAYSHSRKNISEFFFHWFLQDDGTNNTIPLCAFMLPE